MSAAVTSPDRDDTQPRTKPDKTDRRHPLVVTYERLADHQGTDDEARMVLRLAFEAAGKQLTAKIAGKGGDPS